MGKQLITKDDYPEVIECYNSQGRAASYDLLRSKFGFKNPYFAIKRIIDSNEYPYDPGTDKFMVSETRPSSETDVFMDLEELCGSVIEKSTLEVTPVKEDRSIEMERLVHELLSDRLLTLSRYITLNSADKVIMVDQTSLKHDGYKIVTH